MKLKSLLLGSVAAVGLSTSAFAADLSTVVSSFDVCEDLGISGTLQLASTDDCLQISGAVTYEFNWGDYATSVQITDGTSFDLSNRTLDDDDGVNDWKNDLDWWLKFVGSASSEFGTAKAVIKLSEEEDEFALANGANATPTTATKPAWDADVNQINRVALEEAYVSVGDTTTLVAGKRGTSVYLEDNDEPFGFIGLFNSDAVDSGVGVLDDKFTMGTEGRVIQLYHAVGDSGVMLSAGLENLDDAVNASAGSAIGTIAYAAPDGSLVGHASVAAGGILDGTVEDWKTHFGATATMDNFKVRGAFAYGSAASGATTGWNGLVTAEGTFDMFTIAAAIEGADRSDDNPVWGASLTGSAAVTDQVTIAAGLRFFDSDTTTSNSETWQAALKMIAKLTETLTATGEVGYYAVGSAIPLSATTDGTFYGSAELAWEPGGQFASSIKGEINSLGAYKATFKASKTFD